MSIRPRDIQIFETVGLLEASIALIYDWVTGRGIFGPLFSAVLGIALTLLVSRYRKNWARWVIVGMFFWGALLTVALVLVHRFPVLKYPVFTIFMWSLSALSIFLLFRPASDAWLSRKEV